jgi:hypothetical protein
MRRGADRLPPFQAYGAAMLPAGNSILDRIRKNCIGRLSRIRYAAIIRYRGLVAPCRMRPGSEVQGPPSIPVPHGSAAGLTEAASNVKDWPIAGLLSGVAMVAPMKTALKAKYFIADWPRTSPT